MKCDKIVVLDYGSQYNHLIARRIRQLGVYSELCPHTITYEEIKNNPEIKGIVLSGGPNSVFDDNALGIDYKILESEIPILGICYGMQLISHKLKGYIRNAHIREYGKKKVSVVNKNSVLFKDVPETFNVFMSHGDQIKVLPDGFNIEAYSSTCPYAAISHSTKKIYGVQFHPEVQNTEYGMQIIKNFVLDICGANTNWTMDNYIENQIKAISSEVKDQNVLCGLSGGVDSAVTALLIHKAIGDQLTCMFIDHGLLRKGESDQVIETFTNNFNIKIIKIDATQRFLNKLEDITDPELKRKIIGNEFIYVFEEEAKKLGDFAFLAQGTLYTDIIESGTSTANKIKSHHNVGGLPEKMKFKLVEPLKSLFKDEVRDLGEQLGLSKEIVWRQPFPGPGLGIRIIGAITETKIRIVQESDWILREEIKLANLDQEIWQYFTVLLDIRTVGVMGDNRTYDYTIAIRAVTSIDGMTADWAKIPWDILDNISRRIVNEVKGVNRIVYDITSKPPATIEWE